jgi:protein-disulfide isomerase
MKYSYMSMMACLVLVMTLSLDLGRGHAQSSPELQTLKQDVEAMKKDIAELKKAMSEMRELLVQRAAPRAQAPAAKSKVDVGSGPVLGNPDAPVTVIEFSDYQCPFCQRYFTATLPTLKKEYIDTGKVRYVFRDFPLDSIHPQARKAAEAAHCAGDQDKYWDMHDTLFKNQRTLKVDNLKQFARDLGLKADAFDACLDKGKYADAVTEHYTAGAALGVSGTPSFFIGKTTATGPIEATPVKGAQPFAAFRQVIDGFLEEKKP